ncbi:MAG TPA: class I SAM-dependent methyltransferase [Solirubrobacteraceae bacterium]|nr:class I SAM-dependent methyltransferase [Solirubrobacteraceae bacterium]
MSSVYDSIGTTYAATRRPDPRVAAVIFAALGDARSVVNVGAGAGGYEPADRTVLAVEPSATMIAQRPPSAAPAIQASAEELPLDDNSFDAALAVNTVHHWTDLSAGLREARRVARQRVVIVLRNPREGTRFWLVDYLPELDSSEKMTAIVAAIEREFPRLTYEPLALPGDCVDGVFTAFWNRPEMYLDDAVRRNMSNFALADENRVNAGLARLRDDLDSGEWDRRYGHLRSLAELDIGYRILVAELAPARARWA